MDTKWKRLAAILWLWWAVLATWMGVYAAKNEAKIEKTLNKEEPPMVMRQQVGSSEMHKWWKENRFWFAFINQESLTDEQKNEIEKFQDERDEAIKKINDEFFDKLEKFISEEKLEDYEDFVENHENMKWTSHKKWEHKIKWERPMKNIQKPKEENDE